MNTIKTRFARYYSSFTFFPYTKAEEAAWRLGAGDRISSCKHMLFAYALDQLNHSTGRGYTLADTNLYMSGQLPNVFSAQTWAACVSRVVDDQLLAFLGTWSVRLHNQSVRSSVATTTLLDLIVHHCRLEARLRQHEQIVAEVEQQDLAAAFLYSRSLDDKPPPAELKVWLYLEGEEEVI